MPQIEEDEQFAVALIHVRGTEYHPAPESAYPWNYSTTVRRLCECCGERNGAYALFRRWFCGYCATQWGVYLTTCPRSGACLP